MDSNGFVPIGIIASPFREKFGIPRQPGLVDAIRSTLTLLSPYNQPETVRGLEAFSHVWLIFVFHATRSQGWKPTVRPPRLGGNVQLGVFATRSPFRPNALGLSVARLCDIEAGPGKVVLTLGGLDLLEGTPVLDVKPYLPYADALPDARAGFATQVPASDLPVSFSVLAAGQCQHRQQQWQTDICQLIRQVLQQDPRPAYRQGQVDERVYAMRLYDFDLRWRYTLTGIEVLELADA